MQFSPPPDQIARQERVAREAGVEPYEVQNVDDTERALQTRKFVGLTEQFPEVGRWSAQNPRGAIMAQDDAESLGTLGSIWDTIKKLPATAEAAFKGVGLQGAKMNFSLADSVGSAMDFVDRIAAPNTLTRGQLERRAADRRAYFEAGVSQASIAVAEARPDYTGFVQENILQGIEQTPQSAMALVAGVLTRNPNVSAGMMGVQTGVPSYADARLRGADRVTSIKYAVEVGAIETLTEKIPASALVDSITTKSPFGKTLLRQLGEEIPNEQIATLMQDLSEWVNLNPQGTLNEYLAARPGAAAATFLQTLSGTTAQTSAVAGFDRAARAANQFARKMEEANQAKAEAALLDRMADAANSSKFKQRVPEEFRALMRSQALSAGVSSVFIPAQRSKLHRNDEGYIS
nr:hypothetical protein [Altererythrobacter lutimaris]